MCEKVIDKILIKKPTYIHRRTYQTNPKRTLKFWWSHIVFFSVLFAMYPLIWQSSLSGGQQQYTPILPPDTGKKDTLEPLPYPFKDQGIVPGTEEGYESKLYLQKPQNIKVDVEYDHANQEFVVTEKIGNFHYRYPQVYSFEEYKKYDFERSLRRYWRQRFMSENFEHKSSLIHS